MEKSNKLKNVLTQRFGNKQIITTKDSCKRWLDPGSIVSFSVNKRTSKNIEFKINDDENHLIWYSQLETIFFNLDSMSLCCGEIINKDGEKALFAKIKAHEFEEYAKNRRFRVILNSDGKVAKFRNNTLPAGTSYIDAENMINNLIDDNQFEKTGDYLETSNQYTLEEI